VDRPGVRQGVPLPRCDARGSCAGGPVWCVPQRARFGVLVEGSGGPMGLIAKTVVWGCLALLVAGVTGCTGDSSHESASRHPQPTDSLGSLSPPQETARECPVTVPTRASIPGHRADVLFGADRSYGNGRLWVGGLGDGGVIRAGQDFVAPDGSVRWKLGWWREVPGRLEISGRLLDDPAPPLRAVVPAGYGELGFQSSGVSFPSEGCWKLTGRVGSTVLTFVVSVVRT
jgi:hypothetical protein